MGPGGKYTDTRGIRDCDECLRGGSRAPMWEQAPQSGTRKTSCKKWLQRTELFLNNISIYFR